MPRLMIGHSCCGAGRYGRTTGLGGELELQFRTANGEQLPSCRAETAQSTVTFIMTKGQQVSFQWRNPDFLFENPDFLLKKP